MSICDEDIKVERVIPKRRPGYDKSDWLLYRNSLDNDIHAVSSIGSLSKRLEAFCSLLQRAEAEVVHEEDPQKRDHVYERPTVTAVSETQCAARDLRTNHNKWLEMNDLIIRLIEESMRANIQGILESIDVRQA